MVHLEKRSMMFNTLLNPVLVMGRPDTQSNDISTNGLLTGSEGLISVLGCTVGLYS